MTGIQWTDEVWNPTSGCDRVSPGCDHCYALTMAKRLKGMGQAKYQRDGDPRTSGPGFGLTVHPDAVNLPLCWRKPRRIFVNSMSDLFHADVPTPWLADIFAVMAAAPRHTFQVLTKRHARMRSLLNDPAFQAQVKERAAGKGLDPAGWAWPLPGVWLGVSAEDQHWADIRIPALLDTPAAVRFVSAEPLLGPIDLDRYLWLQGPSSAGPFYDHAGRRRFGGGIGGQMLTRVRARDLHWVIAGGESGPGRARVSWTGSARCGISAPTLTCRSSANSSVPYLGATSAQAVTATTGIAGPQTCASGNSPALPRGRQHDRPVHPPRHPHGGRSHGGPCHPPPVRLPLGGPVPPCPPSHVAQDRHRRGVRHPQRAGTGAARPPSPAERCGRWGSLKKTTSNSNR